MHYKKSSYDHCATGGHHQKDKGIGYPSSVKAKVVKPGQGGSSYAKGTGGSKKGY